MVNFLPLSRKNANDRAGNLTRTSWLVVRNSDHQATRLVIYVCVCIYIYIYIYIYITTLSVLISFFVNFKVFCFYFWFLGFLFFWVFFGFWALVFFVCCCILYSTSLSSYVQPDDGHHYGRNM